MANPYVRYYVNQAGSGLPAFTGVRYQRGHGFFGKLFSNSVLPALRYLGKKALSTGVNVAQDLLDGQNIKDSFGSRIRESGRDLAQEAILRARAMSQQGSGRKRKYKKKAKLLELQLLLKKAKQKAKLRPTKTKPRKKKGYKRRKSTRSFLD